jgi:hypothetical protein
MSDTVGSVIAADKAAASECRNCEGGRWPLYIAAIEAVQALCENDSVTLNEYGEPGEDLVVFVEDIVRALAVLAPNKEQQ